MALASALLVAHWPVPSVCRASSVAQLPKISRPRPSGPKRLHSRGHRAQRRHRGDNRNEWCSHPRPEAPLRPADRFGAVGSTIMKTQASVRELTDRVSGPTDIRQVAGGTLCWYAFAYRDAISW